MSVYDMQPYATGEKLLEQILPSILQGTGADAAGLLKVMTEFRYALLLYTAHPTHDPAAEALCGEPVAAYLEERHAIHCFAFRGHRMGILQFASQDWREIQRETEQAEADISQFLDTYRSESGIEVNLSLGRPFQGLLHLQDAYSELINSTMTFSIRPGSLVVSEYDIVNDPALLGEPYPRSEIERQLADAVFNLEIRKAKGIMEEIIAYEMSTLQLKLSFLPRMGQRVEWILIVLHVPRNSGNVQSADIYSYPYRIQYAEGNEQGIDLIREFFDKLDDYYNAFRFNIGKDISQITEFIHAQSDDVNLSATMICDRFRISPSYLSHMFKKRTGVKLVDYIHQVRLARAKSLLESPGLSIAEIASQVGYTSGAAFSTAFKKYEGLTPREYRENYTRNH